MNDAISLRPWATADAPTLIALANDPGIWRSVRDAFPQPFTEADAFAHIAVSRAPGPVTPRAILMNGIVVGNITLEQKDDVRRHSALLSYWIGAEYRGRGIATRAVREITRIAFDDLSLRRVYAKIHATNSASIKVLENTGYVHEGTFKDAIFKNGVFLDQVLYAKVNLGSAD